MKKLLSMMLLACGMLSFVACDDETTNPYATENTITIERSDLFLMADGNDWGYITYTSAGGPVTASTTASWCRPEVQGDSIVIVYVDPNPTCSGRSASIELRNSNSTMSVSITQEGNIVNVERDVISVGDDATAVKSALWSYLGVELLSAPDWLTASLEGDSLCLDISENATGHMRDGYVAYLSGSEKDSIRVVQADFDRDVAGSYKLYFNNGAPDGQLTSFDVELSKEQLRVTAFNYTIPITIDEETLEISVECGQHIGRSGRNQVFLSFLTTSREGITFWSGIATGYYSTGTLSYDGDEGTTCAFGGTVFIGQDYGVFDISGFWLNAYSSTDMAEASDEGRVLLMCNPYLQREPDL